MFIRYLITGILIAEVILIIEARNLYYKIQAINLAYSLEPNPSETRIELVGNLHKDLKMMLPSINSPNPGQ